MSDFLPTNMPAQDTASNARYLIGQQINVLDNEHSWVRLDDVMGDDNAIVTAARVSYLGESKGPERDRALLLRLMRDEHTSPFEMCEVKFTVQAPLVTWWQWIRHRTWSYAGQSGRYTEFNEGAFYIPADDEWRKQSSTNKQASAGRVLPEEGAVLTALLADHVNRSYELYQVALEQGVAREQARLFLPGFAVYYKFVVKTDLHNLLKFCRLRLAPDAQWEIRAYAQAVYDEFIKPLYPWTSEAFELYQLRSDDGSKSPKNT